MPLLVMNADYTKNSIFNQTTKQQIKPSAVTVKTEFQLMQIRK